MEGNFPMRKELMDEYRSLNCFIKGGAPDMLIRKYQPSDCPRLAELFYQTVYTSIRITREKGLPPDSVVNWKPMFQGISGPMLLSLPNLFFKIEAIKL